MKNILIAFLLITGLGLASCERRVSSSAVPESVQTSMYSNFPNAKHVKWQRMGRRYDAKFKQGGEHLEAKFTEDGKFLRLDD